MNQHGTDILDVFTYEALRWLAIAGVIYFLKKTGRIKTPKTVLPKDVKRFLKKP